MNEKSWISRNRSLIITITINAIALITFFVKMDERVSRLEERRNEINPQRVTQKDLMLIEEKMKNMGDNVLDVKTDLKEIKHEIRQIIK